MQSPQQRPYHFRECSMESFMSTAPHDGGIPSQDDGVVVLGSLLSAIATVVVGIRFYTRTTQKAGIGADDIQMLVTLVSRSSH